MPRCKFVDSHFYSNLFGDFEFDFCTCGALKSYEKKLEKGSEKVQLETWTLSLKNKKKRSYRVMCNFIMCSYFASNHWHEILVFRDVNFFRSIHALATFGHRTFGGDSLNRNRIHYIFQHVSLNCQHLRRVPIFSSVQRSCGPIHCRYLDDHSANFGHFSK